jgi:phosphate transport system substrate-binding protein
VYQVDWVVYVTKIVRDYTASIRLTSVTPGAIGFGSVSTVAGQGTIKPLAIAKLNSNQYVNPYIGGQVDINSPALQNGDYPLTRNVLLIFAGMVLSTSK